MTRPDRLEEAAAYIRQTTERVERLKERKRELMASARASSSQGSGSSSAGAAEVEVQHLGSGLHAILVTGAPPSEGASFHRAVRAVEEAGGEVQNAHFSVVGARAIYTIHTLVSKSSSRRRQLIKFVRMHAVYSLDRNVILYCSFNFSHIWA
jgi:phage-related tail protein